MSNNYYPTLKEFSRFNDYYRLKIRGKTKNKKWMKIALYLLSLLGLTIAFISFCIILASLHSASRKSYRHSSNYRKVIKEGILWDTVEYHER